MLRDLIIHPSLTVSFSGGMTARFIARRKQYIPGSHNEKIYSSAPCALYKSGWKKLSFSGNNKKKAGLSTLISADVYAKSRVANLEKWIAHFSRVLHLFRTFALLPVTFVLTQISKVLIPQTYFGD